MLYNSPKTKKIENFQSFLCRNENPLLKKTQTQLVQSEKNPKAKKQTNKVKMKKQMIKQGWKKPMFPWSIELVFLHIDVVLFFSSPPVFY